MGKQQPVPLNENRRLSPRGVTSALGTFVSNRRHRRFTLPLTSQDAALVSGLFCVFFPHATKSAIDYNLY
jgi:hypothetical protein